MINFKNKRIILAVPNHFGLPQIFTKNLQYLGFEVHLLPQCYAKVRLSLGNKITHFSKKILINDSSFKANYFASQNVNSQLEFLEKINNVDYALVIRPDLLSNLVLKKIKEKSNLSVAYQWDGMSRFPLAKNTIPYFDNFFVFDRNDVQNFHGTTAINNFYFDYLSENDELKQDVFFVGTFMKDRIEDLKILSLALQNLKLRTNINVIYNKERHIKNYRDTNINFTKVAMSFEENIINSKSCSIILDFQNSFHKGISFRTFEAVGYGKKLITNNPLVKNYDFYRPENVFVFDNNLQFLEKFVNGKQVDLPLEVMNKYSFSSWIQMVLYKY